MWLFFFNKITWGGRDAEVECCWGSALCEQLRWGNAACTRGKSWSPDAKLKMKWKGKVWRDGRVIFSANPRKNCTQGQSCRTITLTNESIKVKVKRTKGIVLNISNNKKISKSKQFTHYLIVAFQGQKNWPKKELKLSKRWRHHVSMRLKTPYTFLKE